MRAAADSLVREGLTHHQAGRLEEAKNFASAIRKTLPGYRADDFIDAFRFDPDATALYRLAAKRIGLH
jgi:hypothetical protein